jgi:TRAP-type mannitol/chloroaromatic compound transport system substrate-binding protein
MSAAQQETVESACKATMLDGLALGEAIQFDYMKANAESGVTNHYWSDEMLATFRSKWDEVVAELVAEDPEFGEIYGALNEFRANYQIWQEWIYLPRPSKQGQ